MLFLATFAKTKYKTNYAKAGNGGPIGGVGAVGLL